MKKIFAIILILTLVFSTNLQAFGTEAESKSLENVISIVKGNFDIPENFYEFNYSSTQTSLNDITSTYWNLSWNDPVNGGGLYVTLDEDGNFINYNFYKNIGDDNTGLSKVSKIEAEAIAINFLKKVLPEYGDKMKQINIPNQEVYGQEYMLNFRMHVNNVPVDFVNATISVNRYTGEVSNYYFNGNLNDLKLTNYPDLENLITKETATTRFLEEIGVPLKYKGYFEYLKKTMKIFPVYEFKNFEKAIDAKTGDALEIYTEYYGFYKGQDGMGGEESAKGDTAENFTDEEIAAIQKTENLIDKREAEKIARELDSSLGKLQNVSLDPNYIEKNKFMWSMYFEKGYVMLNAGTKEITNFNVYEEFTDKTGNIDEENARNIGEKFIGKLAKDKFDQVKLVENRDRLYPYQGDSQYFTFNYVRMVNGVEFENNGIWVTINKITGKVTGYSSEWYDDFDFPKVENVISEKEIFEKGNLIGNYNLIYKKSGENQISLVYDFIEETSFLVDPFSGNRINFDGSEYRSKIEYEDINGNWAENMILELKENGYYLIGSDENMFMPKNNTLQIEFLRYLYSPIQDQYKDDESFYNMLVQNRIITKEEIAPKKEITRQEVAKYVVRYMGYEKIATKPQMFRNYFKDLPEEKYFGYAAICYAFDVIKGDSLGKFSGDKTINHAEIAKVIYKTINNK